MEKIQSIKLISGLPPYERIDLNPQINRCKKRIVDAIIVLDDDPTGTQTVHDIPVLTEWTEESITSELSRNTSLFYILTNSRSLPPQESETLTLEISRNIKSASDGLKKRFLLISRSDSTLRGHYPEEIEALVKGCHYFDTITFLVPAFFEGGRFTIADIHYVKEGDLLVPAAQTPFAQDKVFGYEHSDLKNWVVEKSKGSIKYHQIKSISINDLRTLSDLKLIEQINRLNPGDVCIVNAAEYFDLKKFSLAVLQSSIHALFRSAASFVAAIACQSPRAFLDRKTMGISSGSGVLIVVGSYVKKTTEQLQYLLENKVHEAIEISVSQVIGSKQKPSHHVARRIDDKLLEDKLVVLYSSRNLVSTASDADNLQIGKSVSRYLSEIVAAINTRPQYIITKGGITSSDVTTQALQAKRAMIRGQILAGVPVWQMDSKSKFPGICQIVFPGNVGEVDGLYRVVDILEDSDE